MTLLLAVLSFLGGAVSVLFLEIRGLRTLLEPVREVLRVIFPDA